MASNLSASKTSFKVLGNSSEFLNIIIQNISSCILILNDKMELQAYNDPIKTIFSNKRDEDLLYVRCGEAIGCAYTVEEKKICGETSKCKFCELREAGMISYLEGKTIFKHKFSREFFIKTGRKVMKHLQFSTRPFQYKKDKYIIVIIDDISKLIDQEKLLSFQQGKINELIKKN